MSAAAARVGIDIGGTFTDAVLLDTGSRLHVAKVRTTPADLGAAFLDALGALGRSGAPASGVGYLVHGSTVATNAVVQGRTARVGLLTTSGFRDALEIGTQQRASLYDLRLERPEPLVPRELRRWASTHAGAYFAVRCFVGSEIRQNDGLTRHIEVVAPEGTILNPRFPAAVSAPHLTVQRLADVLVRALGDLLPDRALASSHVSFPSFVFQAVDPRTGRLTIFTDILGGGGGARDGAAGDNAIDSYTSNCALLPAEIAELEYPWRIERTELVDGSGGAGRWPGGLGLRRDYRLLAERAEGMYYLEQTDARFAAEGRKGGRRGAPARVLLGRRGRFDELRPGKGYLHLRYGDVIAFVGAGGGGFGRAPTRRVGS